MARRPFGNPNSYSTGLQVFTSLDVVMQDRTEKIFTDKLDFFMRELRLPTDPGMQAGAVLIDPATGYLKAIYGGDIQSPYDFSRATQARRQAGSSFKPLVYALAFSKPKEMGYHGEPLIPLETPERLSQTPMDGGLEITVENILNTPRWLKD